jgi:O-antigen ligase
MAGAVFVVVICVTVPFISERLNLAVSDVEAYSGGNSSTSMGWRFEMWKGCAQIFEASPVLGGGTGDYELEISRLIAAKKINPEVAMFNQPHNLWLFGLATKGIPGLLALLIAKILTHLGLWPARVHSPPAGYPLPDSLQRVALAA